MPGLIAPGTLRSFFGDGSDGDVSFSVGNHTLTKDMFYHRLSITGTAVLYTAGFRIFASNFIVVDSTSGAKIDNSGVDASGNTHGTGAPLGSMLGGTDGGDGQDSTGTPAAAVGINVSNAIGGDGGTGSNSTGTAAGGGISAPPNDEYGGYHYLFAAMHGAIVGSGGLRQIAGGAGGGGGGANIGNFDGGGGGGGGGLIMIATPRLIVGGSGAHISVKGGNGDQVSTGGFGGGGGGGAIFLLYPGVVETGALVTDISGGLSGGGAGSVGKFIPVLV